MCNWKICFSRCVTKTLNFHWFGRNAPTYFTKLGCPFGKFQMLPLNSEIGPVLINLHFPCSKSIHGCKVLKLITKFVKICSFVKTCLLIVMFTSCANNMENLGLFMSGKKKMLILQLASAIPQYYFSEVSGISCWDPWHLP